MSNSRNEDHHDKDFAKIVRSMKRDMGDLPIWTDKFCGFIGKNPDLTKTISELYKKAELEELTITEQVGELKTIYINNTINLVSSLKNPKIDGVDDRVLGVIVENFPNSLANFVDDFFKGKLDSRLTQLKHDTAKHSAKIKFASVIDSFYKHYLSIKPTLKLIEDDIIPKITFLKNPHPRLTILDPVINQPLNCATKLFDYQKIAVHAMLTVEYNYNKCNFETGHFYIDRVFLKNKCTFEPNNILSYSHQITCSVNNHNTMHLCIPPGRGKTLITLTLIMESKKQCYPPSFIKKNDLLINNEYKLYTISKKDVVPWLMPQPGCLYNRRAFSRYPVIAQPLQYTLSGKDSSTIHQATVQYTSSTTLVITPSIAVAEHWFNQAKQHYPTCKILLVERELTLNRIMSEFTNSTTDILKYLGSFDIVVMNQAKLFSKWVAIITEGLWQRVVYDDMANESFRTISAKVNYMTALAANSFIWISATEYIKPLGIINMKSPLYELNFDLIPNPITIHPLLLDELTTSIDVRDIYCDAKVKLSMIKDILLIAEAKPDVFEKFKLGILPFGISSTEDFLKSQQIESLNSIVKYNKKLRQNIERLSIADLNTVLNLLNDKEKLLCHTDTWPKGLCLNEVPPIKFPTTYESLGCENDFCEKDVFEKLTPLQDRLYNHMISQMKSKSVIDTNLIVENNKVVSTIDLTESDLELINEHILTFKTMLTNMKERVTKFHDKAVAKAVRSLPELLSKSPEQLTRILEEIIPGLKKALNLYILASERIKIDLESDCPICMDVFHNYCLFAKCSHIICLKCHDMLTTVHTIGNSSANKTLCPVCRQDGTCILATKLDNNDNALSKETNYLELVNSISEDPNRRLLVFIDKHLVKNELSGYITTPEHLTSNDGKLLRFTKTLADFKEGRTKQNRVLILESSMSAGIEMTYVTDILFPSQLSQADYIQAIGRVIRTGCNNKQLKIHNLIYKDEVKIDVQSIIKLTVNSSEDTNVVPMTKLCLDCKLPYLLENHDRYNTLYYQAHPECDILKNICKCSLITNTAMLETIHTAHMCYDPRMQSCRIEFPIEAYF